MKIRYHADQGTANPKGASVVDLGKIFGVLSTTNEVFLPSIGPKFYNGLSGGQLMATSILKDLADEVMTYADVDAYRAIIAANDNLRSLLPDKAMIVEAPAHIPFARYALLFLRNDGQADILAGGDCQAIVQYKDGRIVSTENQARGYDLENYRLIAQCMERETKEYAARHGIKEKDISPEDLTRIREAMWFFFEPKLIERRNQAINKVFSAFNGDYKATQCWQRLHFYDIADIEIIICYTGGFMDIAATADMNTLAGEIINEYHAHGLKSMVATIQNKFSLRSKKTHITKREAAAIVLEP